MREIKFRAWDKRYRQMLSFELGELHDSNIVKVDGGAALEDCEIMQFTGLYDRSGKEIYEGDIVATGTTPQHVKSIVRIGEAETYFESYERSYSKPYYGVYLEGSCDLEEYLLRQEMYIIGNIYEHPAIER